MNHITIVVYDNLNGKSTKLFSVESNKKNSLEKEIAGMILALERKIDINPMLIAKHISVTKGRHHTVVEMFDYISHPEDFTPFSSSELEEHDLIEQRICDQARMKNIEIIGSD